MCNENSLTSEERRIIIVSRKMDQWVYRHTQKPTHYVRVKNPPRTDAEKKTRPQDARQEQFNRWCARYRVYCGSYLPAAHRDLLGNGWDDTTHPNGRKYRPQIVEYTRRSTQQRVVHHEEDETSYEHYHWLNPNNSDEDKRIYYLDRFGVPAGKGKMQTHLAPLDRDFVEKRKIR